MKRPLIIASVVAMLALPFGTANGVDNPQSAEAGRSGQLCLPISSSMISQPGHAGAFEESAPIVVAYSICREQCETAFKNCLDGGRDEKSCKAERRTCRGYCDL